MLNGVKKAEELVNYLEKLKTNKMAQTAVEWFVQQLEEYGSDDFKIIFKKQFEQAKAIERQKMIDAMMYTFNQQNTLPYGMEYIVKRDEMLENCVKYYKETYNNSKQIT